MKRLLDVDPLTGLETWHDYDPNTDTTRLTYHQDAEPLLDACKRDNNHADKKLGEMAHVASVPPSVQLKWLVELGVDMFNPDHKGRVRRLLDGEYKHLKRLPIMLGNYDEAGPRRVIDGGTLRASQPALPPPPLLLPDYSKKAA